MDFTREPIVETVITPKEGFKLIIRSSSGSQEEEYSVGAVEVVAFGNCYFFRSLEKPKEFLLPMAKYEIIEARETRTVLKKPQVEKSIKIGGGQKPPVAKASSAEEEKTKEEPKKNDKRRSRKRRTKEETQEVKAEKTSSEEAAPPPPRRTLLPPPTSLISDQIDRYKDYISQQEQIPKGADKAIEKEEETSVELPHEEKIVDITEKAHVPPEENEES